MKKVAIYSFFESHNMGDVLIAKKVKDIFSHFFKCAFYDISTGKSFEMCSLNQVTSRVEKKEKLLKTYILRVPFLKHLICGFLFYKSKSFLNIVSQCDGSDMAVFAGGNIIMELNKFPTWSLTLYRVVKELKKRHKKVCFCFCGVGPFENWLSKRISKRIVSLADFISVRDVYSLTWVQKFVPNKNVEIWPDPVLLFESNSAREKKKMGIGVNVYFGHNVRNRNIMKAAFIECIRQLRTIYKDKRIYLFSSELTDMHDIKQVHSYFSNDSFVEIKCLSTTDELFGFLKSIEVAIATRMHSVITALISNVPVVSIAWQGKVASVMELLNISQYNVDVDCFALTPNQAVELVKRCINHQEEYITHIQENILRIRSETNCVIKKFVLSLEE